MHTQRRIKCNDLGRPVRRTQGAVSKYETSRFQDGPPRIALCGAFFNVARARFAYAKANEAAAIDR